MRILVNAVCRGGIGRYGLLLGEALTRHVGVTARVLVSDEVAASPIFGRISRDIGAIPVTPGRALGKAFALGKHYREIARFRPDIVHDTSGCSGPLAPFCWSGMPSRTRLVVTEHDVVPHFMMGSTRLKRLARRRVRRVPDHVVVHGHRSKTQFLEGAASGHPGLSVIPHGELGVFAAGGRAAPKEERTVLFFGALRPNKGVDWLIEIADLVRQDHPDARFIVAGPSTLSREFRGSGWAGRLAKILEAMRRRPEFEVHDRFIPDEEVGQLFQRASICLLPYRDATASGVAALAMPLGSVVVGTRVGDLAEQLHDGRVGQLVDPDPASIAAGVIEVFRSREAAAGLRERARRHAAEEISWELVADRHVRCYRSLIGERQEDE